MKSQRNLGKGSKRQRQRLTHLATGYAGEEANEQKTVQQPPLCATSNLVWGWPRSAPEKAAQLGSAAKVGELNSKSLVHHG